MISDYNDILLRKIKKIYQFYKQIKLLRKQSTAVSYIKTLKLFS